ncbi:MAG: KpsF/GutQ family sugar-phosphate isomerase [Proteobacteria bacterium]|uniref:Arabinose 5-phosphate isomerase n=1 Tax=Candidatus Avisuccinivibrio stercorigallinarum TaxID=2840704 RepID=A0A9D9DBF7_9GAMM|nr:KpsF/GutQ family sugar-phosphate isomerase [Candidatus Avisuccinivibrio stercorigallinarum]
MLLDKEKCLSAAQRVLREEAEALLDLIPSIGSNFVKACELLLQCKGKVILTGVGKSGHVATKIASSLASTGTQSFFVQAGEAAHGDLGMIGKDDVVIAVSNSGEGNELKIIIPILKRRQIPLIAICGDAKSTLATEADVFLSAHVKREACPLNLAPTNSTTAELAVGDAIMVALIEARGFTKDDFALSHPGGALGRRLLVRCEDLMHQGSAMPAVKLDESIENTLIEMTEKGLGMVAVLNDDGSLAGIYTDGDLRRTLRREISIKEPVSKVMTANCVTVGPQTLAAQALAIMQDKKISGVIVVDDKHMPLGAFNMHDLLRAGII